MLLPPFERTERRRAWPNGAKGSSSGGCRSPAASALADEAEVVDPHVVVGALDVHLPLHAVDLGGVDVRLARRAPALHLLHVAERDDEALPLLGQVQIRAEVVDALAAH